MIKPEDARPPRGGWAPGRYSHVCVECGAGFTGDKRAVCCADCAYEAPQEAKLELLTPLESPTLLAALEALRDCLIAYHRDYPCAVYADTAAEAIRMGHSVIIKSRTL